MTDIRMARPSIHSCDLSSLWVSSSIARQSDKSQKNKQTNGASRLPQNPWNTGRGKRLASMTNAYRAAAFYYNYSERENPTHHRSPRQISRCLLDFSIRHFKNKGVREIQLRVGPRRVIQESLIKPNLMLEKSQRQKLTAPERERAWTRITWLCLLFPFFLSLLLFARLLASPQITRPTFPLILLQFENFSQRSITHWAVHQNRNIPAAILVVYKH